MTMVTDPLTEIAFDGKVRSLGASDAARSSFTAHVGNSLIALSPDLNVLGRPRIRLGRGHSNPRARGSTKPDSRTPLSRTRRTVTAWWSVSTSILFSRLLYRLSGHSQPESR
jgi:hypothetical protein